jgi:hypothetical protein
MAKAQLVLAGMPESTGHGARNRIPFGGMDDVKRSGGKRRWQR